MSPFLLRAAGGCQLMSTTCQQPPRTTPLKTGFFNSGFLQFQKPTERSPRIRNIPEKLA